MCHVCCFPSESTWSSHSPVVTSVVAHEHASLCLRLLCYVTIKQVWDMSSTAAEPWCSLNGIQKKRHGAYAGDPVEAVLLALEAAEKVFGVEVNSLGYKVPKSCGVIQGDGINVQMLDKILQAVLGRGFSAQVCSSSSERPCITLMALT